ncbi:hypothetical protein ES708_01616 [subsurface metagenome]
MVFVIFRFFIPNYNLVFKIFIQEILSLKKIKRSNYKKIRILIGSGILLITIIAASMISVVLAIYGAASNFSFEVEPDPATFIDADYDDLAEVAYFLDDRYIDYHFPLNLTSGTYFINNTWDDHTANTPMTYTNVSRWFFSDNEALWTGISYAGWTYKYLAAINEANSTMEIYAQDALVNMTSGLAHLMIVPNGGLGSDYGGILGRGYAPPWAKENATYLFNEHPRHFNGTGDYNQWRWRGYTSNDEHGGYYMFLALAIKYLLHIDYIGETVPLIVDQLCNYMLRTNFLGIHGTGALTGVDQKPRAFVGGFWAPLLLKMGAICYPEKYERIYHQYVPNEMIYLSFREGGPQETIANYYAYNFGSCVALAYLLLEDHNTEIGQILFDGYVNSLWKYTKYHRNAWFNSIFLMVCYEQGIVVENVDTITDDISDQLMRFTTSHYPDLHYFVNRSELPEGYYLQSPSKEFTDQFNISPEFQDFIGIDEDELFLNKPLTADLMPADLWMWEKNPYRWNEKEYENLRVEEAGMSFTVPYWMMRYCGYILPEGN